VAAEIAFVGVNGTSNRVVTPKLATTHQMQSKLPLYNGKKEWPLWGQKFTQQLKSLLATATVVKYSFDGVIV
jgi:hypothetical protein